MKKEHTPDGSMITSKPLTASKKIYVEGKLHPIKVGMREITLTDTVHKFNGSNKVEKNAPVVVYDTSGPFTDPSIPKDVRKGLYPLREKWILGRGDVKRLDEISSAYGRERLFRSDLDPLRFNHVKKPLRAKPGPILTPRAFPGSRGAQGRIGTRPASAVAHSPVSSTLARAPAERRQLMKRSGPTRISPMSATGASE